MTEYHPPAWWTDHTRCGRCGGTLTWLMIRHGSKVVCPRGHGSLFVRLAIGDLTLGIIPPLDT